MVCRVDSHLYSPSQIHDFIKDIEGDLQVMHDTLKARSNPGKRCAYCLFVDNLSRAMSIPMDPPYCLVYPTSMSKTSNLIISTPTIVLQGHTCIVVYAAPPCSSVMKIQNSILNTSGVTSSCLIGHNTMNGCTLYSGATEPPQPTD